MTPRSIISLIALLGALLLGGYLGYLFGHHGAVAAEAALAKDVATGKVQVAADQQLITSLKASNTSIQASYDAAQTKNKTDAAASDANWQARLAQQGVALNLATKNSTSAQVNVNSLKAALFLAMTPDEKALLQKQLDGAQAQLVELQARTDGLKCLSVPIPKEYLDATNGVTP